VPGAWILGYVFCTSKKGNSLQQERNQCLTIRDKSMDYRCAIIQKPAV
jgi:hypothetical protein